jgi:uncharacterized membrane protein
MTQSKNVTKMGVIIKRVYCIRVNCLFVCLFVCLFLALKNQHSPATRTFCAEILISTQLFVSLPV